MSGERIVVPASLRMRLLKELHRGHPGATRMKRLARSYVYWPKLDTEIETVVRNCTACVTNSKDPNKIPLHPWEPAGHPWDRVHADFAGPIDGTSFLIVVDAYSRWPEIVRMKTLSSTATIRAMDEMFARYGNPEVLVTDNGTQFTADGFRKFVTQRGINHVFTPPFHPQSNCQAERFVDNFKRSFRKS